MRFPLDIVDNDDMEQTIPQTDRARAPHPDRHAVILNLGRSEELDDDDVGDIADEGTGRRG